jgi:hypothetical protein
MTCYKGEMIHTASTLRRYEIEILSRRLQYEHPGCSQGYAPCLGAGCLVCICLRNNAFIVRYK